ncbi:FecR family protein [Aquiflexum sp.]|uniref:FecR family protein n=1 Tax=Aquiflexum sp. TaxID=1872584 RepID=UPI00359341BE
MKYKDFDIEDFLMDEFFIKWVKSPDEETDHFWSKWIQSNPEKKDIILVAKEIIESIDYLDKAHLLDEEYTEIFEGIQSRFKHQSKASDKGNYWLFFRKLVAVLFIVSCISLGYFVNIQIKEDKIAALQQIVTKETTNGMKSQFVLSDGTKVYLNSGSKLIFPKGFYGNERRVKLIGEAFFEVKQNSKIPFFVEVGENEIKVLGTSFNAHYRDVFTVALVTGKVEVGDTLGNRIFLSPNEMLIKEKEGKFSKTIFDPLHILGWKDNYLIFNDDRFDEVLSKLKRWYGVEFIVSGSVKKDWSYTGTYQKETLQNVLEGISITSNFSYEISGQKVNITINP